MIIRVPYDTTRYVTVILISYDITIILANILRMSHHKKINSSFLCCDNEAWRNDQAALLYGLLTSLPSECGSIDSRPTIRLPGRLRHRRTDHTLLLHGGQVNLLLGLPYGLDTTHGVHPHSWG